MSVVNITVDYLFVIWLFCSFLGSGFALFFIQDIWNYDRQKGNVWNTSQKSHSDDVVRVMSVIC